MSAGDTAYEVAAPQPSGHFSHANAAALGLHFPLSQEYTACLLSEYSPMKGEPSNWPAFPELALEIRARSSMNTPVAQS